MNPILKHGIIVLAALALLLATVLAVPMPAEDDAALSRVRFGYPLPFVSQDFSDYVIPSVGFFRYVDFDAGRPISDFSVGPFLLSMLMATLGIEVIVLPLEFLKERVPVRTARSGGNS